MRTFALLLIAALLAACGQTGDLYLPSKTPPAQQDQDKDKKKAQPPQPASTQPAPPQPN